MHAGVSLAASHVYCSAVAGVYNGHWPAASYPQTLRYDDNYAEGLKVIAQVDAEMRMQSLAACV